MKFILENPIIFIILTTILTVLFTFIIDSYIIKPKKENEEAKKEEVSSEEVEPLKRTPSVAYKELIDILDSTINRELYFWLQLTVNMKDVKIIDFAKTVEELSRAINDALSKDFISDLSYYHDEKWIMRYIVRTVKIYVTDYIRKHPIA